MMPNRGSRLESFRQHRDHYFAHDGDAPIAPDEREGFTGLAYYPERKDLALELPLDTTGDGVGEHIDLPTSDGQTKPFIRAGRVHFEVDGQPVTLSVFTDRGRGRFFVPFKDGTTGTETYDGGRYLDPKMRPDGTTLVMDLNYAYNPYCAYGDRWSCPLPPAENAVGVPIPAGEKAYARPAKAE